MSNCMFLFSHGNHPLSNHDFQVLLKLTECKNFDKNFFIMIFQNLNKRKFVKKKLKFSSFVNWNTLWKWRFTNGEIMIQENFKKKWYWHVSASTCHDMLWVPLWHLKTEKNSGMTQVGLLFQTLSYWHTFKNVIL